MAGGTARARVGFEGPRSSTMSAVTEVATRAWMATSAHVTPHATAGTTPSRPGPPAVESVRVVSARPFVVPVQSRRNAGGPSEQVYDRRLPSTMSAFSVSRATQARAICS